VSTPNPATTDWVPLWSIGTTAIDLRYTGAWGAGTYTDGDVVLYNGVAYLCVRTTTAAPAAWPTAAGPLGPPGVQGPQGPTGLTGPAGAGVPTVVNGQWLKGTGGAAVWAAIQSADVAGLVASDAAWHLVGAAGEPAFGSGWSNLDGIGVNSRRVRYRKLPSGIVVLTGIPTGGASGSTLFTLPTGWRPGPYADSIWVCYASGGLCTVSVASTGAVVPANFPVAPAGAVNGWVYLNATWYAEA
jgi:hypothetical protein